MSKMSIFNNPYKTTETWTSQGAVIEYYVGGSSNSTAKPVPMMISGLSMTFTRQKSSVYPLNQTEKGGATKININGAPSGQLSITSIYCPTPGKIAEFLKAAARDCALVNEQMVVTIRPFGEVTCGNKSVANSLTFTLTGVELVSLGVQIQSGEVTLINMPLQFTFTDLDYLD